MLEETPLALIGQDPALAPVLAAMRAGGGAHAYLITGPAQAGKSTLARLLAATAVCPEATPPCGRCRACRHVAEGRHPDVETVTQGGLCDERDHDHSVDRSRDIRICQVRRAERYLNLAPLEGRGRVVIIDPADALNTQSADAFLKTLEEPPKRSLILLVCAEPDRLPETLRSRCRSLPLALTPAAEIARFLMRNAGLDATRAELLARLAGGRPGWALAAARDPDFLERRARRLDETAALAGAGRAERLSASEKLAAAFTKDRDEVTISLALWIDWWRDVLLCATGVGHDLGNPDRREEIAETARRVNAAAALRVLHALRQARLDLEANVNARLALDALMLNLPPSTRGGSADGAARPAGPAASSRRASH